VPRSRQCQSMYSAPREVSRGRNPPGARTKRARHRQLAEDPELEDAIEPGGGGEADRTDRSTDLWDYRLAGYKRPVKMASVQIDRKKDVARTVQWLRRLVR